MREELPFSRRHLPMTSGVPLSRLELLVSDLVLQRGARVVRYDASERLATHAVVRMSTPCYQDVSSLVGGIATWEAEDFRIYRSVHVPGKTFAEVVEHDAGTP